MNRHGSFDAVLLIGFGGPTRHEEIRPFLDNVLRGRPVPKERYEEVVHHYETIGGRSPYNELTTRQFDSLRVQLHEDGIRVPIFLGMRNWAPYILDSLSEIQRAGACRVLGFILAAHRCEASWERYLGAVEQARATLAFDNLEMEYTGPWHTHPAFIEAVAARVGEAADQLERKDRESAELIFTAHSIPVAMSDASGYATQIEESSRRVAKRLGRESWKLAFQSRSGSPREMWLEPDIRKTLREAAGCAAIVVPIGFLCDHVEVQYDLDVEAAKTAHEAGVRMVRAGTVGNHPAFIKMMAVIIGKRMGEQAAEPARKDVG